ncbi:phospholipase D family protein [Janibacter melonis]|uniref:phospholipase D family protein n=1 Tax=Janibacter melonis TaxID=262209 RepID=UPI002095C99D|nr:phospholipase D family protein [Janibacter melonis]
MLTPDGRSVLLDDLRAPAGYEIDHAVATTFTLDLTAAMLPPFAFADLETTTARPDPIAMLHALRRASEKVDIFCQAGAIGVPRSSDLVAFLEPMVHQVSVKRRLFHPKTWVMRFTAEDMPPRFRVLVLSRNLTHDNTWDIAVRLDSDGLDGKARPTNKPLSDLLRWLPANVLRIDPARSARILELASDIATVRWEHPEDVEKLAFQAVGLPGHAGIDLEPSAQQLVISPFVTPEGLARLGRGTSRTTLISRQETLDLIPEKTLEEIEAYTMAADAEIPQTPDQQADDNLVEPVTTLTGLHAKVFVREPTSRWTKATVLLGSANATEPGLRSNVELMVEIEGRRARLGVDQVLPPDGDAGVGIRRLVEPYVRQDPPNREENEIQRRLQTLLRDIAARPHTVQVARDGRSEGVTYRASVTAASPYPLRDDVRVTVALLTRPGSYSTVYGTLDLVVDGLDLADITPCLEVTAGEGTVTESTVVLGELVGVPDGRLDAVIARQVNDPAKFIRLLLLLLNMGDPAALAALLARDDGSGIGAAAIMGSSGSGILELVLRGLDSRGEAIEDVQRLVDAVDETVLPERFAELWDIVVEARRMLDENL